MINKNNILFTNDVETHSIFYNDLRADTGYKVYKDAIPYILDLYDKYNIKSTFFITGYIAKLYPNIVKIISNRGHEIGSHGLTHEVNKAFDILPLKKQIMHLRESKNILEDLCSENVISFRAPALRVNRNTPTALYEAGFKIDSSISPQRFDFFFSFGSYEKISRLFSPRKIYFASQNDLSKKGNSNIIEVPLSSFGLPFVGSLMRSNNKIFKLLRLMLMYESVIRGTTINYYMHPTEFITETSNNDVYTNRRTKSWIQFVLADIIRRKIKLINLGENAKPLYEELLQYFIKRKFNAITMKDYCKLKGFLK